MTGDGKIKKILFESNFLTIFSIAILSIVIVNFATSLKYSTKEIKLMEGNSKEFNINLPYRTTIETETINVLKVNNEPILENITIDSNQEFTLEPGESGQASMTLSAFGIPMKTIMLDVLPNMEVIPCGTAIGVRINTDGVMVLGTGTVDGNDGKAYKPGEGVVKTGDLILSADNTILENKEQFMQIIKNSNETINLKIKRQDEIIETSIKPVMSSDSNKKIGVWIRDSTQGIGTVTYYNPESNKFAALGHGILDIDTRQMMSIKKGEIMESDIVSVVKGKKGAPGELIGDIKKNKVIGSVEKNSPYGIYGSLNLGSKASFPNEKLRIALQDKVHEGPAVIRSTVDKDDIKEYDIFIENVNRMSADDTRGMVIRITDPELIKKTNGIVQGMSGSPIIQDGNLIGAVTHVFVQEPSKGYGIFIENMLKYEVNLD